MRCPWCSVENVNGALVCANCGQRISPGTQPIPYQQPMAPSPQAVASSDPRSAIFMGALIVSIIGALLLILTGFAGWTESDPYYGGIDYWISLDSEQIFPFAHIIIILLIVLLFLISYFAVKGLQNPYSLSRRTISRAFGISLIVFVLTLLSGVLFMLLAWEAMNWWFEAGFYGAFLGGLLSAIFLRMATKYYPIEKQPLQQAYQQMYQPSYQQYDQTQNQQSPHPLTRKMISQRSR